MEKTRSGGSGEPDSAPARGADGAAQPAQPADKPVHQVAIGVLVEPRAGRPHVLVARRPKQQVLGGYWELPGGKIEPDERPGQALRREFAEELGLDVRVGESLPVIEHSYDHAVVRLQPFYCTRRAGAGEPHNRQVAEHRWVTPTQLRELAFPPANAPLIDRLQAELGGAP